MSNVQNEKNVVMVDAEGTERDAVDGMEEIWRWVLEGDLWWWEGGQTSSPRYTILHRQENANHPESSAQYRTETNMIAG